MPVHRLDDSQDFPFLTEVFNQLDTPPSREPVINRVVYALASWEDFFRPAYHYDTFRSDRLRSYERIFVVTARNECRRLAVPSLNLSPGARVRQGKTSSERRENLALEKYAEHLFEDCFDGGDYLDKFEKLVNELKDRCGFPEPHGHWLGSVDRQLTDDDRFIVHCEFQEIRLGYVPVCQWVINLREIVPHWTRQRRAGRIVRYSSGQLPEDSRTN